MIVSEDIRRMKPGLLLLSLFTSCLLQAQDSVSCVRSYDRTGPVTEIDSFFFRLPNRLFIDFNCCFEDTAVIYLNGRFLEKKYLSTNPSIDLAGGICVSFEDSTESLTLKVLLVKARTFFSEKLDLHFKALNVWTGNRQPWRLYYSNHFPLRE